MERNKLWLLPLLGVGVLGVLWMNFQVFKPKAAEPAAPLPPPPSQTSPVIPAAPPPPVATPMPASAPSVSGPDIWSDLRLLETPPPELTRVEELLLEGEKAFDVARLGHSEPPILNPKDWQFLPEPEFPRARPEPALAAASVPLPKLDFVLEDARGEQEAWFAGRAYREGDSPDGIHRIRKISRWSVVLSGPGGELRLSTELGRVAPSPKANPRSAPAEAL